MRIYTIGFTKTSAQNFFERLKCSGAVALIDIRLNNVSQLAGFAKRDDLEYFSETICGIRYKHKPILAPTKEILDDYKKHKGSWDKYVKDFNNLMVQRKIENLPIGDIDGGCLLCSEDKPDYCHRRLVAEYLQEKWGDVEIIHL